MLLLIYNLNIDFNMQYDMNNQYIIQKSRAIKLTKRQIKKLSCKKLLTLIFG